MTQPSLVFMVSMASSANRLQENRLGTMLRVCLCVSVCVSVCHAGIVSKRLNVGSRKQHYVIAQGLVF